VTRSDIEGLKKYGFTDGQILEAVLVTGLARFANIVSSGLGTEPDFEPTPLP
jgi:alkylhydroperoxidase family enzyme